MTKIISKRKSVELITEAVVVDGQFLPINASSSEIATDSVKTQSQIQSASETARFSSSLAGSSVRSFSLNEALASKVDFGFSALGAGLGLFRRNRAYFISIPQNSVFVLKTALKSNDE